MGYPFRVSVYSAASLQSCGRCRGECTGRPCRRIPFRFALAGRSSLRNADSSSSWVESRDRDNRLLLRLSMHASCCCSERLGERAGVGEREGDWLRRRWSAEIGGAGRPPQMSATAELRSASTGPGSPLLRLAARASSAQVGDNGEDAQAVSGEALHRREKQSPNPQVSGK